MIAELQVADGPSKVGGFYQYTMVVKPQNESPQNGMQSIVIEKSPVKTDTNAQLISDWKGDRCEDETIELYTLFGRD